MACLICGDCKTIDAHLMPRAFALEVRSQPGEKHAVAPPNSNRFHKTNTGVYDREILCGSCDNLLGKHEGYVFKFLKEAREQLKAPGEFLFAEQIDGDAFVKFAAGLCWKYCVTKPEFGQISIGPYVDELADVAFEHSSIPSSIDATAIQLQFGDAEVYFYRAPRPYRNDGVNFIRFFVGGFLFFLKIDKRRNPSFPSAECWLRGKAAASFGVAPGEKFEEWKLYTEIAGHPTLRSYFERMRRKGISG